MPQNFALDQAVLVLERTPAVLRSLLGGLPEPWVTCDEGPDTFSPFENVGHLLHGERADWIVRARRILDPGDNRRFDPFDRFAHRADSAGKSLEKLLDEFEHARRENLATLRSWELDEQRLELTGEHPALGTVTLRQLLATWVAHDLGHIAQVCRVMAKHYREDVGPWQEYLPIVNR